MKLKFVQAFQPLLGGLDCRVPAGRYTGILVKWVGTAETGVTAALTDFGTILVRHRGRNIVNARAAALYKYCELVGGHVLWASAVAGAVTLAVWIPFRYGAFKGQSDDNLLNCGPDELFVQVPAVDPAVFATLSCSVSVTSALGVPRYIVQISESSTILTNNARIELSLPNLRRVLIDQDDISTDPDSVFMTRGDSDMLFEGPWAELEALSDMQWYREAAGLDAVMVELGRDDFASFVGGRYNLRMVAGVGTAYVCEFGALPVSGAEKDAGTALAIGDLLMQYRSSPEAPTEDVSRAIPATAISAGASVSEIVVSGRSSSSAPGVRIEAATPQERQAPPPYTQARTRTGL